MTRNHIIIICYGNGYTTCFCCNICYDYTAGCDVECSFDTIEVDIFEIMKVKTIGPL